MYVEMLVKETFIYKENEATTTQMAGFISKIKQVYSNIKNATVQQINTLKDQILKLVPQAQKPIQSIQLLMLNFKEYLANKKIDKEVLNNDEMLLSIFHYYVKSFGITYVHSLIPGSPKEKLDVINKLVEISKPFYEKNKNKLHAIDELTQELKITNMNYNELKAVASATSNKATWSLFKTGVTWGFIYYVCAYLVEFSARKKLNPDEKSKGFIGIFKDAYRIITQKKFDVWSLLALCGVVGVLASLYKMAVSFYNFGKLLALTKRLINTSAKMIGMDADKVEVKFVSASELSKHVR